MFRILLLANFYLGQTSAEFIAAANKFDDEERRDTGTTEKFYVLRLLQRYEEVVDFGNVCGQNLTKGWDVMIIRHAEIGLYPGTADTISYEESKTLTIKWLEEDLSNSTFFAMTFAVKHGFIEAFYETFWLFSETMALQNISGWILRTRRWKSWFV
jgi:hypothetical protein